MFYLFIPQCIITMYTRRPSHPVPPKYPETSVRPILTKTGYVRLTRVPYVYQHYIPPTYVELWQYNEQDMQESRYSEHLRKKAISGEF
jgi:hypothetical protein